MTKLLDEINQTITFLQSKVDFQPEIGIVLGSGLGNLVDKIDVKASVPYHEIPNFPAATVKGHGGQLIFGYLSDKPIVAMSGRFHYYEGHGIKQVVFPIRVMKYLGITRLLLSNAAGGLNPNMKVGDLMIIEDHINMQPEHPLRGSNDESMGPRFPDMMDAYNKDMISKGMAIAEELNYRCLKGVYVGVQGPTFETPAEYKCFHRMGGDAVGMSTVPEVIVARHMGLDVFAMSVIADMGYPPEAIEEVSHDIVIKKAAEAEPKMTEIITRLIASL